MKSSTTESLTLASTRLTQVFLTGAMALAIILLCFCAYLISRQANAPGGIFDPSIIHKISSSIIYGSIFLSVSYLTVAFWSFKIIRTKKKLALIMASALWILCVSGLVAGYWGIAKIEGRYIFKSRYFLWYLYIAVPMALFAIMGFIGIVWSYREK